MVQLGYYRGIMNQLDQIEAAEPACAPLIAQWRDSARQFRFEAMSQQLADQLGAAGAHNAQQP